MLYSSLSRSAPHLLVTEQLITRNLTISIPQFELDFLQAGQSLRLDYTLDKITQVTFVLALDKTVIKLFPAIKIFIPKHELQSLFNGTTVTYSFTCMFNGVEQVLKVTLALAPKQSPKSPKEGS